MGEASKDIVWIGSSLADLQAFPEGARAEVGVALWEAQNGCPPPGARALKLLPSVHYIHIPGDFNEPPRAVYFASYDEAEYVLHCCELPALDGTPRKRDLELIERRFNLAQEEHSRWLVGRPAADDDPPTGGGEK